jgi:dolichol-phosphate mannosyltransferase
MRTVIVVLPVYNEASRLKTLLDRIGDALGDQAYRIIAVDDGSRDGGDAILAQECQHLPLQIVTHVVNRGLAQTLYDGLRCAVEQCGEDDVVVTMDADDTHDPAYIRPMLAKIEQGCDVVIASRFQSGAAVVGVPAHRRLFSIGVMLLLRLLTPADTGLSGRVCLPALSSASASASSNCGNGVSSAPPSCCGSSAWSARAAVRSRLSCATT